MNLNFTFNRKNLSSEEISSRMDFGEVLSNYKIVTKPFYKTGWFYSATAVTIAGITTLVVLNLPTSESTENKPNDPPKTETTAVHYKEDSPCVNPPQKNADVPFEIYQIENSDGGKIIHHSGTEINIPQDAFGVEGIPVSGKIEIRYRELRDAADFIVSGIPMTYDTAGVTKHFESAGMIEIRAFQDGKELKLNPGVEVDVHLASDYGDTKYNFYHLNEEKKQWECIGKDKVKEPNDNSTQKVDFNPAKAEEKIAKNESRIAEIKTEVAALKKSIPEEPHKKIASNYSFTMDILDEEFPEMKEMKNQRFEVASTEKTFNEKIFSTEWENIKIEKGKTNGKYYLTLTKSNKDKRFEVYPVFEGAQYSEMKSNFDREFAKYNKELDNRLAEEKRLEAENKRLREETIKRSKDVAKDFEKKKSEQTAMPSESDLGSIHSVSRPQENQRIVSGVLTSANFKYDRSLKLPSMGIFNCDNAVKIPIKEKGKKHRFSFKDRNGVPLIMSIIFVLEKKRNVMFTYQPHEFESIKIKEDENHCIVGLTKDGSVAVATNTDMKVLNWEENNLDVSMQVFKELKDVDELRNIITPNS